MNLLAAVSFFAARQDRSIYSHGAVNEHGEDCWPFAMAAAVHLSGQLEDCKTQADLDAAAEHFFSLLDGGILSLADWQAAAVQAHGLAAAIMDLTDNQLAQLEADLDALEGALASSTPAGRDEAGPSAEAGPTLAGQLAQDLGEHVQQHLDRQQAERDAAPWN